MRKLISIVLICCLVGCLYGCDGHAGDKVSGDRNDMIIAVIKLPDGTIISGDVDSYTRWGDSNIRITIDGVSYYVHPANCVLMEGA